MTRILVAEDDPVMAKLIEFNLKREGFEVVICIDGDSVEERARALHPDLAMFDLNLPGKSGLELSRAFEADDVLRAIPRVVVTGQGKEAVFDDLYEAGVKAVFTKPFSPSTLVEKIREILD